MGLIEEQGLKPEEMYKTFNMRVGFCVVSPKSQSTKIISIFKKHKIVKSRNWDKLLQERSHSKFSKNCLILQRQNNFRLDITLYDRFFIKY